MPSVTAQAGDTFESLARRVYGSERYAERLRATNPDAGDTPIAGSTLVAPAAPFVPASGVSDQPDETIVTINGQRFRYWTAIRIRRSIDGLSTVDLEAPFDHSITELREAFRPFAFQPVTVAIGDQVMFTGTMVSIRPEVRRNERVLVASAYAAPGILADCSAPAGSYPIEFNQLDLGLIAERLCDPYALTVEAPQGVGPMFERVALDPGQAVWSFLAGLARQRSRVLTDTPLGAIQIYQPEAGDREPVAHLKQGAAPLTGVSAAFNQQEYFSHVTALEPVNVGTEGSQFTVRNPHLVDVARPYVFRSSDVQGGDIKQAAEAKAGRMVGNMAAIRVSVATPRDQNGDLWQPDTFITLEAPDVMIYSEYTFLIRAVETERSGSGNSAVLTLTLPGAFKGEIPEAMPWDE